MGDPDLGFGRHGGAARLRRWVVVLGVGLAGCTRAASPAPAEAPVVSIAPGAAFRVVRGGLQPAFAQGDLHVFVNPSALALDTGLPGIGLGDARGPTYELLGGYFAPRLIPPQTDVPHRVTVEAAGAALRIRFHAPGAADPVLDATVTATPTPQVVLRGSALVVLPADRVQVQGTWRGTPAFSAALEASGPPEVRAPRADRVEVVSERHGAFALALGCPRPTLVKPIPRGSTSSFLIHVGPRPPLADPLYTARPSPCPTPT